LKLKCDIMLSTSDFKFNLRRYTKVSMASAGEYGSDWVGRRRLTLSDPC
jgi:hypothetical protein